MKHRKWLAVMLAAAMMITGSGGSWSVFAAGLAQENSGVVEETQTEEFSGTEEESAKSVSTDSASAVDVGAESEYEILEEGVLTDVDVTEAETVYVSFTPERDGRYIFTAVSDYDTYGYLCDENMEKITEDDDSGKRNNFRIEYELAAGTLYRFGVRYYSSDYTGTIPVIVFEDDELSLTIRKNPEDAGEVLTVNSTESYTLHSNYLLPEFTDDRYEYPLSLEAGQKLTGFSLTEGSQELDYTVGDSIRFTEDTTLYAVIEDIQFQTLMMGDNEVSLNGTERQYYEFTPEEDGQYLFYSMEENYDFAPGIILYESKDFDNSYLDGNTYSGSYNNFRLSCTLSAGRTYYIAFYDDSDNYGTINVHAAKAVMLQFMQGEESLGSAAVEPGENVNIYKSYVSSDYMSSYSIDMPSIEEGYIFAGWSTHADAADAEYKNGESISITEDTILYPVMQEIQFQTMQLGENSSRLGAGDAAYYAFTPEESGSYLFYCTGEINAQTYLYESKNFSGEYMASGSYWGEYGIAQITADLEAGKTYYLSAQYYEPGDAGMLTFVAARACKVTFTSTYSVETVIRYGETITFGSDSYTLSNGSGRGYDYETPEYGYRLAGWSQTEGSESAEWTPGKILVVTEDITLYAVYEPIPYELLKKGVTRVAVNGQDFTYAKFTPEESGSYVIYADTEVRTYAVLYQLVDNRSEYYLTSDRYSGIKDSFRLEYDLEAGSTYVLKIQCESENQSGLADIYVSKAGKVTFQYADSYLDRALLADGETLIFDSADRIRTSLKSGTIYLDVAPPAGYRCIGWSRTQEADRAEYAAGDEISFTEDTTLYPVFAEISYKDLTEDTLRLHWKDNDNEYMQFTPAEDGEYIFYSTGARGYSHTVSLYTTKDTSEGPMDITSYGTNWENFRFTAQLEAGHTYYLHVSAADGYEGVYRVWVKKAVHLNLYSGISEEPEETIPLYPGEEITFYSGSINYQQNIFTSTNNVTDQLPKGSSLKGWAKDAGAAEADYVPEEKLKVSSDLDLYAVYSTDGETGILPLQIGKNDVPSENSYFVASFTPEEDGSYLLYSGNMNCTEDGVILYDDSSLTDPLEYASLYNGDNFRFVRNLEKGTTYYIEVSGADFYGDGPYITVAQGIMMTLKLGSVSLDYILQSGEEIRFGNSGFTTTQNGWSYDYSTIYPGNGKHLIGWSMSEGAQTPDYEIGETASFDQDTVLYAVVGDMTASLTFADGSAEAVLAAGETAYIRLEIPKDGYYMIYTRQEEDTYGYLYDENWAELERNDDDGPEMNFQINRQMAKGTYYVGVRYYGSETSGTIKVYARRAASIVFRGTESRFTRLTIGEGDQITFTDTGYQLGENDNHSLSSLVGVMQELKGWSLTEGAAKAEYTSGSILTCTEDMTLYAVTQPRTCTVFGEGENPFTSSYGGTVYGSFTPAESGTYLLYSTTDETAAGSRPVFAQVYLSETVLKEDTYSGSGSEFRFGVDLKAGTTYYVVLRDQTYDEEGVATQDDISKSLHICKAAKLTLLAEDNSPHTIITFAGEKVYAEKTHIRLEQADPYYLNLYGPDNKELAGWSTSKDAAQASLPVGGEMTLSGDTTLYPVWKDISYQDAVLGENAVSIPGGEDVYLRFTPDSDGSYIFYDTGTDTHIWFGLYAFGNYQEDTLGDVSYESYKNNQFRFRGSLDGGRTYYIRLHSEENDVQNISLWIRHAYELKFRGEGIMECTEYAADGEKIFFTSTGIRSEYMNNIRLTEREDMALAGWTTVRGGTSVQYPVGEERLFTADTRLYPVWKEISYTELQLGNNTIVSGEGMMTWGTFTPARDGLYLFSTAERLDSYSLAEDRAFEQSAERVDVFWSIGTRIVYNLKAGKTYYYRQRGGENSADETTLKIIYQPVRLNFKDMYIFDQGSPRIYVDSSEKVSFEMDGRTRMRVLIDNRVFGNLFCYRENVTDLEVIGLSRTQNAAKADYKLNTQYTFTEETTLYPVWGTAKTVEKIELDKTSAEMVTSRKNTGDSTLQLKVTALPEGAAVPELTWTSSNENVATVDQNGKVTALTYGTTTITAAAKDNSSLTASCTIQTRYYDVDPAKYWYKHVYWAADKGITSGFDNIYFGPEMNCTREQMITFLYREAGKPTVSRADIKKYNTFSDVASGKYYEKAVVWAAKNGITKGYTSGPNKGKFGVGFEVTREDTVTFLYRMAKTASSKFTDVTSKDLKNKTYTFTDVVSGKYYQKAIVWAAKNGITKGYSSGSNKGKFGVGFNVLRGDIVTFLSRYDSKF